MIWIILVMYVWAGLTTACALRQFNDVKLGGRALPFKESIASVRYSVGVHLPEALPCSRLLYPFGLAAMRKERLTPELNHDAKRYRLQRVVRTQFDENKAAQLLRAEAQRPMANPALGSNTLPVHPVLLMCANALACHESHMQGRCLRME